MNSQTRRMLGQHVQMPLRRKARCFTRFGGQIQHQRSAGGRRLQCGGQPRHQDMRNHAGEPRARPEDHEVGGHHGIDRLTSGRRVTGQQPYPAYLAGCGRHRDLTPNHPAHPGVALQSGDIGLDLQGDRAHGQDPTLDSQNAAEFIEGRHRIGKHLVQTRQQQVADRMAGKCATSSKPMLDDRGPQPAVGTVGSQGRQRHSKVSGRYDVKFGTQSAR